MEEELLKWNVSPEHLKNLTSVTIQRLDQQLNNIPNDDRIIEILQDSLTDLQNLHDYISFFQYVSPNKKIRDISAKLDGMIANYLIELGMRKDIFLKVEKLYETMGNRVGEQKERFLRFIIRDYKRSGLHLPKEKMDILKMIKKKLNKISIKFNNNINNDQSRLHVTLDELAGVPEEYINSFKKKGDKYEVPLKKTTYAIIMSYAHNENTRKNAEYYYNLRGGNKNVDLLKKMVLYRYHHAKILGYKNHVDYQTEVLMSKNNENVRNLLQLVSEKIDPLFKKEVEILKKIKGSNKITTADIGYYKNIYKKKYLNYDEEEIRKYFPLDFVTKKMIEIFEKLFSIKIKRVDGDVWFSEVEIYKIEELDGNTVGYFYLDLLPRENKYYHAACFGLRCGSRYSNGKRIIPICALVTNFTPKINGKSFLKFSEVNTYFHEFGHCLHSLFGQTTFSIFSGTSVERDFVETPSQLIENLLYDTTVLQMISNHRDTGKHLPIDLINTIQTSKNLFVGIHLKQQIFYSVYDNWIHSVKNVIKDIYDNKNTIVDIYHQLNDAIFKIPGNKKTCMPASFGHLSGGYDGRYYGYIWSEIIADDIFESRFKGNVLDSRVGREYRNKILSQGGCKDAVDMIKDFLGRNHTIDAFIRNKI